METTLQDRPVVNRHLQTLIRTDLPPVYNRVGDRSRVEKKMRNFVRVSESESKSKREFQEMTNGTKIPEKTGKRFYISLRKWGRENERTSESFTSVP